MQKVALSFAFPSNSKIIRRAMQISFDSWNDCYVSVSQAAYGAIIVERRLIWNHHHHEEPKPMGVKPRDNSSRRAHFLSTNPLSSSFISLFLTRSLKPKKTIIVGD